MPDYSRPSTQWADTTSEVEVALPTWSLLFDDVAGEYVLQAGRPSARAAFVPSDIDPTLYVLVEQVNGEAEALMMQVGEVVHVFT